MILSGGTGISPAPALLGICDREKKTQAEETIEPPHIHSKKLPAKVEEQGKYDFNKVFWGVGRCSVSMISLGTSACAVVLFNHSDLVIILVM